MKNVKYTVMSERRLLSMADFRYKSLKPWKINDIDLTQQFSLSIFTDFRHQSITLDCYRFLSIDYSGGYGEAQGYLLQVSATRKCRDSLVEVENLSFQLLLWPKRAADGFYGSERVENLFGDLFLFKTDNAFTAVIRDAKV